MITLGDRRARQLLIKPPKRQGNLYSRLFRVADKTSDIERVENERKWNCAKYKA